MDKVLYIFEIKIKYNKEKKKSFRVECNMYLFSLHFSYLLITKCLPSVGTLLLFILSLSWNEMKI